MKFLIEYMHFSRQIIPMLREKLKNFLGINNADDLSVLQLVIAYN